MRACARAPSAMLMTSTPALISISRRDQRFGDVETRRAGSPRPRRRTFWPRFWPRDGSSRPSEPPEYQAPQRGGAYEAVHRRLLIVSRREARVPAMRAAAGDAANVLGGRAAAPADEAHAELEHAAREHAEVLGRRDVDEALVDPARQTGVGHRGHRETEGDQLFERREHVLRDRSSS